MASLATTLCTFGRSFNVLNPLHSVRQTNIPLTTLDKTLKTHFFCTNIRKAYTEKCLAGFH